MKTIHFSVDDTFGCFRYLSRISKEASSIWDSSTFSKAKAIHELYGLNVDFYCIYTDGKYTLDDFSDKFKEEFSENSKWMKFGFHAFDGESNYNDAFSVSFSEEYITTKRALERLVGKESMTDCIRLHFFSGNKDIVKVLKEKGITTLLCADDDRNSYGLSEESRKRLSYFGRYKDTETGMIFKPTHYRLEKIGRAPSVQELEAIPGDKIEVFTHERYLRDEMIMKRLEWFI